MNRYRVTVVAGPLSKTWDIDASTIAVAANRALRRLRDRDEVSVKVQLLGRNIVRPRIERQSHGRVREPA